MEKYSKDGEFNDPIVRCTECSAIVKRDSIKKFGMCSKCGNRRVRNVLTMSQEEMEQLRKDNVDPEFLVLFEGVNDV